MAGQAMVEVTDLQKHYGAVRAVDGITFSVNAGEVFGLLGHNGASKTTTIRMLTGRARPTAGPAFVADLDAVADRDRVKPLINAVFEDPNLYDRFTGIENLRFFATVYGVKSSRAGVQVNTYDNTGAQADQPFTLVIP